MGKSIDRPLAMHLSKQHVAWKVFEEISKRLLQGPEQPCPCCGLMTPLTEKIERLYANGEHAQGIHRATGVSRYYIVKHLEYTQKIIKKECHERRESE